MADYIAIATWPFGRTAVQAAAALLERGRPALDAAVAGGAADHDTVAVLARDVRGDLAGCCTTSGLAQKLPGRVGDSPLIGHGLYVDNAAGAAGATGVGEEVSRIVGSFVIVEQMRSG